jgi:hypothetical protein
MRNSWSIRTDWRTPCRRAAGCRKYQALRRQWAQLHRRKGLGRLDELSWTFGVQARLSRHLGVSGDKFPGHRPLAEPRAICGTLRPRSWKVVHLDVTQWDLTLNPDLPIAKLIGIQIA